MIFGSNVCGGTTYGGVISSWLVGTFNLRVFDQAGTAMQSVKAEVRDKNDTLVVDETTDVNGAITEQILFRGVSPHTIKLSKGGYGLYKGRFTVDRDFEWIIGMQHSTLCVDQEAF